MQQIIPSVWSPRPPMGWNSWDCFGVNVTEAEVRENADFMARYLKAYGWEYIVVDLDWYAPEATKDNYKAPNIPLLIDEYGRLIPDPQRFPSAAGGQGFRPLADYVHSLGLKLGIHIMRGIPWNAVEQNTPIKGTPFYATDIADPEDVCQWYNSMQGIHTTHPAGRAYYASLIELYASWGVDYIKADDINSWDGEGHREPYHTDEVEALSHAIVQQGRPMVLSLSPGAALLSNKHHLRRHAHLWRISADFWDDWSALKRQFARCARWAPFIVQGHWPDPDMLPFGGIGIRGEVGETRQTYFNEAELHCLMSLWCIFRAPLMYGGHLPMSDPLSLSLITNAEALRINQASIANRCVVLEEARSVWYARSAENPATHYLALFNLSDQPRVIDSPDFRTMELPIELEVTDIWGDHFLGRYAERLTVLLGAHEGRLYRLR